MDEHKHLRRLERVFSRSPVYFITTNTRDRRKVLANDGMHAVCNEVWNNARRLYGWSTGPYVIMPDHVHFFCRTINPEKAKGLSFFVGKWKEWVAKSAIRKGLAESPLWQPEFFDHLLRNDESLREKGEYVWQNPVRAGIVEEPEDWPYRGNHDDWGL